jgi:crooked neck
VKKKRKIQLDDGEDGGWEEYVDYIYPDDEVSKPGMKILEFAMKWKQNS